MSDKTKIRILEDRIKSYEAWMQHRVNVCVANPDIKHSPMECYDDALAVFKLTFNRDAGE